MMGGYIRVTSVKDEGSIFTIYLPRVANNASTSEKDDEGPDDNNDDKVGNQD